MSERESETETTRTERRRNRRIVVVSSVVTAVAVVGWAVARPGPEATAASESTVAKNDAPVLDGSYIRFSDAFAKRAGMNSEAAREEALSPSVTVSGTMTYDPRLFAAVGARIGGRVRRVHKLVGDVVKPGDILAELESAELGRAEAQVMAARAKEKAAEADMKRERRLADARITAEREAELAHASYEAVRAERVAAERAVEALGGDMDDKIGILVLRSPIAGRVVKATVARGQTLEPSDTLFEIADTTSLWVELQVFERDVPGVRADDAVELRAASPGAPMTGKVAHVGDVIDPETRTAAVRVVVNNQEGRLRPGQSVVARIQSSSRATRAVSVSRRAVTRIDGKPTVFVLHDKNTVEPRVVATGPEDTARTAIVDGLKPGERVVTDGMFALKSEIFR